jgi:hypothetical protein
LNSYAGRSGLGSILALWFLFEGVGRVVVVRYGLALESVCDCVEQVLVLADVAQVAEEVADRMNADRVE